MKNFFLFLFSLILCFAFSCKGGGSSASSISGLSLPDALEILQQDPVTTSSARGIGAGGTAGSSEFEPDSDFATDETRYYVWDDSMEAIGNIDGILQLIAQTKASLFVNDGAYIALVDESAMEREDNHGNSSGNESSSDHQEELNRWTVVATRADKEADQIVRFWVPQHEEGVEGLIYGYGIVEESPSSSKPYGEFELHFSGQAGGNPGLGDQYFYGTLSTSESAGGMQGFDYFETMPMEGRTVQAKVLIDPDNDQVGSGRVSQTDGSDTREFAFAYNESHFVRRYTDEAGTPTDQVFSRDDNDLWQTVWRYNVYTAHYLESGLREGTLVGGDSGMPFKTITGSHGHIGYWGIWAEDEDEIVDGMTVQSDQENPQDYTLHIAPGRLMKVLREYVALENLDDSILEYWNHEITGPDAYQLIYDHDATTAYAGIGSFHKVAEGVWGEEGIDWTPLTEPYEEVVFDTGEAGHFWSELRGLGLMFSGGDDCAVIDDPDNPYNGDLAMIAHVEEIASTDETLFSGGDLSLSCWTEAPKSGIGQPEWNGGDRSDFYYDDEWDLNSPPYTYYFSQIDLGLYNATTLARVGLADGVVHDPENGGQHDNQWGIRSGPLLTDTQVSATSTLGLQNAWELWNELEEYYIYETGPHSWNKHAWLEDSLGANLTFSAPLRFLAEVEEGDDINGRNDYNGLTFTAQYGGPGELWGLPWEEDENGNWRPLLGFAPGFLMGDVDGGEYVSKPVEIEMQMTEIDGTDPSAVGLDDELNTADSFIFSVDGNSFDLECLSETAPELDEPPKVIKGKVQ